MLSEREPTAAPLPQSPRGPRQRAIQLNSDGPPSGLVNLRLPRRPPQTAGDHLQLLSAAGVAAVLPWWGVLQARVVQLRHRADVGAAWRQPSRAPRQRLPAVTIMARFLPGGPALHRPLAPPQPAKLRRQRPGAVLQVQQVAEAVERSAVEAARPAAPIAGLGCARTGVVGRRPAAALAALVEPRSRLDADLPGPVGLPAGHQVSPPLAWLPGSDQLTTQAGTATPEPHGTRPPYSPPVAPAGRRLGAASDPKARRPTHRRPRVPPGRRGGGAGPRAR